MHEIDLSSKEFETLINNFKKELTFKVVVIGDFGVGKTSIIKRYIEGVYMTSYKITIGADFAVKTYDWNPSTRIILQMWDIAGHERFGSLTSVYYRYAVAAVIVFDLTRPETFKSVKKWLYDLRSKVQQTLPVVLLANKGDVNTSNLPPEIVEFCAKNNILAWFITSAKEGTNIDQAMLLLVKAAFEQFHNEQYTSDTVCVNKMKNLQQFQCCR
ncbi:hypothetical protein FQA39_LY14494 [Lamprigera yunnana]|nr:hypothetical protein FQA39_LY14494 [Lamprigera yunnana]